MSEFLGRAAGTEAPSASVEQFSPIAVAAAPTPTGEGIWYRIWQSLWAGVGIAGLQGRERRLRVRETVSLGDKRFVSILEVDGRCFLIGGGAGSVSLLSTLQDPEDGFENVLNNSWRESGRA